MAVPRFHVAIPLAPAAVGSELALPEATAHHAVRVRRLATGDALVLFDGAGGEYAATLTRVGKRAAHVRLDAFVDGVAEPARAVTLAQALVATDTMDTIVRHAVELGASIVQPLVTARSTPFPAGAHGAKRIAHWQAIAVAACEQCGRNRIPAVANPVPLAAWLALREKSRIGIVLAADSGVAWSQLRVGAGDLDVLVGPEGGFALAEVADAQAAGFLAVSLGPRILRAQTAALAALAAVSLTWDDA
ncbi:MAG: 16S rRNA (uracil(1498)-N(3))-methyltransferase [Burkholderiales bacterium]|nr:16S rRNA (uracil(1498)-N(3))-methyltransferase [Burkholderiales bacterium]